MSACGRKGKDPAFPYQRKSPVTRKTSPFAKFSDDDLIEELLRRRNAIPLRAPKMFCDNCKHFVGKPTADANYNPCQRGHRMAFHLDKDDWTGRFTGFYRKCCPDRTPNEETL